MGRLSDFRVKHLTSSWPITYITYIINLSIKQRTFPDDLKIAKVIPIFKQGSRSVTVR